MLTDSPLTQTLWKVAIIATVLMFFMSLTSAMDYTVGLIIGAVAGAYAFHLQGTGSPHTSVIFDPNNTSSKTQYQDNDTMSPQSVAQLANMLQLTPAQCDLANTLIAARFNHITATKAARIVRSIAAIDEDLFPLGTKATAKEVKQKVEKFSNAIDNFDDANEARVDQYRQIAAFSKSCSAKVKFWVRQLKLLKVPCLLAEWTPSARLMTQSMRAAQHEKITLFSRMQSDAADLNRQAGTLMKSTSSAVMTEIKFAARSVARCIPLNDQETFVLGAKERAQIISLREASEAMIQVSREFRPACEELTHITVQLEFLEGLTQDGGAVYPSANVSSILGIARELQVQLADPDLSSIVLLANLGDKKIFDLICPAVDQAAAS